MTDSNDLQRLQENLKAELLSGVQANPKARLTRRGQAVVALAVVAAVATPTGALALQSEDEGETSSTINLELDMMVPAPAPLCIDRPELPVCDDPPSEPTPPPSGADSDLSPERLTPEQERELLPTIHEDTPEQQE